MAKTAGNQPFGIFSQSTARAQESVTGIPGSDYTFANGTLIRALWVDVAGTVVGRLAGDDVDSTWSLAAGVAHPLAFAVIRTAGTTATGIKGLI